MAPSRWPWLASAAVVVVVLVAIVATLLDQRRRLAVDLIAEGREA
jgi:heme exporter protein D